MRVGFLNTLFNTASVKALYQQWWLRRDVRRITVPLVQELDSVAELLGLKSRASLVAWEENGVSQLRVPAGAPATRVDIQHAFTRADIALADFRNTLLTLSAGRPGDLGAEAADWTGTHLPAMPWVAEHLVVAFAWMLKHKALIGEGEVLELPNEVRVSAPQLRSDLEFSFRAAAGTDVALAERQLDAEVLRARERLAEDRRLAEGSKPAKMEQDYVQWGEITCRHMVDGVSITELTRAEYADRDDWRERTSAIRYRIRRTRESLERSASRGRVPVVGKK